jgi:hypothetical protein
MSTTIDVGSAGFVGATTTTISGTGGGGGGFKVFSCAIALLPDIKNMAAVNAK